ncbi:RNA polymerase factor sigma-54 [Paenibacillus sp. J22TS3]|uniref:RNA polymerase factor sigma-54 n=1 Tax=Paenibacillus sp. J22TS3 TaxID=2807192 RepID=UPI001B27115A|nr:RNA polymerase factor sigma-54 [Paenibacillus sp. J22TS3]GIP21140.1 RNA polymerase sigma-54 factor [Paenibacillus sp. J22TS3]
MLGYQLVQDQRVKLAITPELKQSIHILSLSGYELIQYLQEQAMENPVLELEDNRDYYLYRSKLRAKGEARPMQDMLGNVKGAQETLEAKLKSQLRLLSLPAEVYRAAAFLAGNLNEDGYLDMDMEDIQSPSSVSAELLETALEKLQSLEPAGIGCRNLKECLLLQIVRDPSAAPYAYEVVSGFLTELAKGNLGRIASDLKITKEQVQAAVRYIRGLNPRPGQTLTAFEQHYIVPDAVVERAGDSFTVALHASNLPRLSMNRECREWVSLKQSMEASAYLKDCMKSARWVIRSVEMRKATLLKVIYAIMEEQSAFLTSGVRSLRPLNLNTIASRLEMHESTVSRAVQGKFVFTPHGVFLLKYFFAAGLTTSDGSEASSRKVKARIKEIIDSEDRRSPYSDQKIVDILFSEGVQLSRRTVTKYREEMRILSSSSRKQRI